MACKLSQEPVHALKTTDLHTTNTENFTKVWESRQHIHDVKHQLIGPKSLAPALASPPSEARNNQVTQTSKCPSKNEQIKSRERCHTHLWYWHALSHIHVSLNYKATAFVVKCMCNVCLQCMCTLLPRNETLR